MNEALAYEFKEPEPIVFLALGGTMLQALRIRLSLHWLSHDKKHH
jgi:hypothetical protein